MKKVFALLTLAAALLCVSNNVNAQISVHAGFLNDIYGGDLDESESGFYAGANYNFNAFSDFGIAPGVYVASSTDRFDLRIPVLLNYHFNLSGPLGAKVFAGPQVNLGLSGDLYDAGCKKFGLGLNFGAGFCYEQFSLEFGYMLNFIDQSDISGLEYKLNQLTVGLGYNF